MSTSPFAYMDKEPRPFLEQMNYRIVPKDSCSNCINFKKSYTWHGHIKGICKYQIHDASGNIIAAWPMCASGPIGVVMFAEKTICDNWEENNNKG